MELLDIKKYFPDFDYPKQLKKIAELDLADFDFWFLMDVELAKSYTEGMAKRFSARHLAPFAKRGDCDDVPRPCASRSDDQGVAGIGCPRIRGGYHRGGHPGESAQRGCQVKRLADQMGS